MTRRLQEQPRRRPLDWGSSKASLCMIDCIDGAVVIKNSSCCAESRQLSSGACTRAEVEGLFQITERKGR